MPRVLDHRKDNGMGENEVAKMVNDERDTEMDLNSLVADCAGLGCREQESYLSRLVMKILIEHYRRTQPVPDANVLRVFGAGDDVLQAIRKGDTDCICAVMRALDCFYAQVARSLLSDSNYDVYDVREKAIAYMHSDLRRRRVIQQDAEVCGEAIGKGGVV